MAKESSISRKSLNRISHSNRLSRPSFRLIKNRGFISLKKLLISKQKAISQEYGLNFSETIWRST